MPSDTDAKPSRLTWAIVQQVEEIALYNTTFKKLDGGVVLFSNALIASTGFSNLSRSGLHNESFKARLQFLCGATGMVWCARVQSCCMPPLQHAWRKILKLSLPPANLRLTLS